VYPGRTRKDSLEIVDVPKTDKSRRAVPLGHPKRELVARRPEGVNPKPAVIPDAGRYEDCIEALHIAAKASDWIFAASDGIPFGGLTLGSEKNADDTLAMQQLRHADRATTTCTRW
jgi:hypothetical protein